MKFFKQLGIMVFFLVLAAFVVSGLGTQISDGVKATLEKRGVYSFTFPQVLEDEKDYPQVFFVLKYAQEGDICIFHLNGLGGNAETMLTLINAMHTTHCFVVAKVDGDVYSAYAFIAVAGDALDVAPGKFLMFHGVQIGGDEQDKYRNSPAGQRSIAEFNLKMAAIAEPFLTKKELAFILQNYHNELYVMGPTMSCRFNAVHTGVSIDRCADLASSILTTDKARQAAEMAKFVEDLIKATQGQARGKEGEQCKFRTHCSNKVCITASEAGGIYIRNL